MHGDAADEMVRMVLNGTGVAIKLTGSAAKNLAALLVAWSKNEKKVYGKTSMMKLLKSGEPLQVLSMTREQYSRFKGMAKKKVLYAPFLNKKVVGESELLPGDLVFWQNLGCDGCHRWKEVHHVGIYMGDGKVIEASSSKGRVVIRDLWSSSGYPLFMYGRPY